MRAIGSAATRFARCASEHPRYFRDLRQTASGPGQSCSCPAQALPPPPSRSGPREAGRPAPKETADDRTSRRRPIKPAPCCLPSPAPLSASPPFRAGLHAGANRDTCDPRQAPSPGSRLPPSPSPLPLTQAAGKQTHTHTPPGGTHLVEVGVPGDVVAPLFDGQGPAAGSRAAPRLAAAAPADAEEKRPPAGPRHPQQAAHRHHRPAQRLLRARSGDGGGRGRRWPAGREGRGERAGRARRRCDRPGGPPPKRKATREADPASTPRRVAPPPLPVKAQPAAEGSGVEAGCPPGLHLRSAAGPEGRRLARPGLRFPAIAAPEGAPRPAAALRSSLLFPPCFLPLAFNEGHQERKAWAPAV